MTDGLPLSNRDSVTIESLGALKKLETDFLKKLGLENLPGGGVSIPYYGEDGARLYLRECDNPRRKNRFFQTKGTQLLPYGLWRLDEARRAGYLWICEGESDAWAVWACNLPALGLPGANTFSCLQLDHIEELSDIFLLPDNAGERMVKGMACRLAALKWPGRLWRVAVPTGHKDVSAWRATDPEHFAVALNDGLNDRVRIDLPERTPHLSSSSPRKSAMPPPKARLVPPYQPFPVDSLPPVARSYVRQGAAALGCDPAYVALPVLAVLASAIGNTRTIRLKRNWAEPAVLWTAIIGDSGTLKSPAFELAVKRLYGIQERDFNAHAEALEMWESMETEERGEEPKPTLRRVIVADVTIEKLAAIMSENPRGILVARDELAGWIGSFTKYKGKAGGSDGPNWLELNRAGTLIVDRKTSPPPTIFIKRAAASIAGGIQPRVLARALTPDLLDSGMAARLLLAWPPRRPKKWSELEIAEETEAAWNDLLDGLLDLRFAVDRDGKEIPRAMRLSPEAHDLWTKWYNEWAVEQAAVEGEIAAAYSKIEAYSARFALVYHVGCAATNADEDDGIGIEAMQAGIALARWFAGEARRIYSILDESDAESDARRLTDFIAARGGQMTVKDLQRSNSRKYPTADIATEALESLAASGQGTWQERPAGPRGGRPTRIFTLSNAPDETDETDETEGESADETSDETSSPL